MVKQFQIQKEYHKKYIIKKRIWLIPPIYDMRVMMKNEFFDGLPYDQYKILSQEEASFKSIGQAQDALYQYAQINGIERVKVKIC